MAGFLPRRTPFRASAEGKSDARHCIPDSFSLSVDRMAQWLRRSWNRLEHPRAFIVIVALAALLVLPTLGIGFYSDDWMFLAVFERELPLFGSRFDLYHFASGGPGVVREQVHLGMLPWWTDPDI